MRIVDLGAWPGGWVQVAAALVGSNWKSGGNRFSGAGTVFSLSGTLLQGDATDPVQQEKMLTALGGPADVVLSDLAPKLSGIKEVDEARSMELCRAAFYCARTLLRPGGVPLLKVFMGSEHKTLLSELRSLFTAVKTTKPESSRKGSAETYVVATEFKKLV